MIFIIMIFIIVCATAHLLIVFIDRVSKSISVSVSSFIMSPLFMISFIILGHVVMGV